MNITERFLAEWATRYSHDESSVPDLLTKHYGFIHSFVKRSVHPNDVDDVAQAAATNVLRHQHSFDPAKGPFTNWAMNHTREAIRTAAKSRVRQPQTTTAANVSPESIPSEPMAGGSRRIGADMHPMQSPHQKQHQVNKLNVPDENIHLMKLIDQVPDDRLKHVLKLRLQNVSHKDIGMQLGLTEDNARQLHHRAIMALKGIANQTRHASSDLKERFAVTWSEVSIERLG